MSSSSSINSSSSSISSNIFCIYEEDYNPSTHKIIETYESMNECKQNCVCTDCSFEDISNLENYTVNGATIALIDYFDTTQSIRVYTGTTGRTLVVPPGYSYAVFISSNGTIEEQEISAGQVLTFRSGIILGGGRRWFCDGAAGCVERMGFIKSLIVDYIPGYDSKGSCEADCCGIIVGAGPQWGGGFRFESRRRSCSERCVEQSLICSRDFCSEEDKCRQGCFEFPVDCICEQLDQSDPCACLKCELEGLCCDRQPGIKEGFYCGRERCSISGDCCEPEEPCCGGTKCCANVCCEGVCCDYGEGCCGGKCCKPEDCNNDVCSPPTTTTPAPTTTTPEPTTTTPEPTTTTPAPTTTTPAPTTTPPPSCSTTGDCPAYCTPDQIGGFPGLPCQCCNNKCIPTNQPCPT